MGKKIRKTGAIFGILALLCIPSYLQAQDNSYSMAVNSYMKKDFKSAVRILKQYVKETPDPQAYYLLGYALYKQKKHAESAYYFDQAYLLDPGISPAPTR